MRGCLFVVVFAVVFVLAVTWVAGPAIVGSIVLAGLGAGGFTSATRTVTVDARPPLELLLARAHEIRIDATGASVSGVHADRLAVTLTEVALLDRTFASITVDLTAATVRSGGTDLLLSSIKVAGPTHRAPAVVRIPAAELEALISEAVRKALPVAPTTVKVGEPDIVTIGVLGRDLTTTLGVDAAGRVILEPAGGGIVEAVLFDPATVPGMTLTGVRVVGSEVVVDGFADVARLLPTGL